MFLSDEQKLSFLSKISTKLSVLHGISSYEYELFNLIKSDENNYLEINGIKKVGEENNANEEKIENRITKEKIKTNIEKIISYIKDKKDFEFISDFFISESPTLLNNDENEIINDINNNNINNGQKEEITNDFLNFLGKTNLSDINSINELNKKLKEGKSFEINEQPLPNLNLIKKKHSSNSFNGLSERELFLNDIKKAQNSKKNENEENLVTDKEMEEEINRQIFGYTKKMKESARNFGVQFKKDNKVLSEIEDLQEKVNDKTTKEVGRLKEFNYSIRLGFCKLVMLNMIVFGTFFATIFIIKVFPKLA
jgi:hypothetical protein